MKKILVVATLLTASVSVCSQAIEKDKKLHFGASTIIASAVQYKTEDWRVSMSSCMAVGLAKELYDEVDYGGFSVKDLVADGAGCAFGTVLGDTGLKLMADDKSVGIQWSFKFK